MKQSFKYLAIIIPCCVLFFFWNLFCSYHHKIVHVSFDDVSICLKDLSKNSKSYDSAFEQPFLSYLKRLHTKYGAKFTLFIYEEDGEYNIKDFPLKYTYEFRENADWLKFGYHAKNPLSSQDSIKIISRFEKSYNIVDSCLSLKFGNAKSSILRLHYFYDIPNETKFLAKKNILCLLTADDNRTSYSLPSPQNDILKKHGSLSYNNMTFKKTDVRIEKENIISCILKHINDNELIVFTHEWAFQGFNKFKFDMLMCFLGTSHSRFTN